jgi:hypothetical protein
MKYDIGVTKICLQNPIWFNWDKIMASLYGNTQVSVSISNITPEICNGRKAV